MEPLLAVAVGGAAARNLTLIYRCCSLFFYQLKLPQLYLLVIPIGCFHEPSAHYLFLLLKIVS